MPGRIQLYVLIMREGACAPKVLFLALPVGIIGYEFTACWQQRTRVGGPWPLWVKICRKAVEVNCDLLDFRNNSLGLTGNCPSIFFFTVGF